VLEKSIDILDLAKDRERMKKELVRKFRDLSTPILGKEKTEKLVKKITRLEKVRKMNALTNLSKG